MYFSNICWLLYRAFSSVVAPLRIFRTYIVRYFVHESLVATEEHLEQYFLLIPLVVTAIPSQWRYEPIV